MNHRNGNFDIYVYDLTKNEERQITNDLKNQFSPQIYNDKIVWEDDRNENSDIYIYDLTKNKERQITSNSANQYYPQIYNDKIVWEDDRNGNPDIYIYDLTKNKERQITSNSANQYYPQIYDKKIVWEDYRNGNPDIYMYDLTKNKERQITDGGVTDLTGLFPNNKIMGGYDFSDEDENPIDDNGHGTHVAATAAGNGILKGVAPDAKIYAYKVFPNSYDDVIISAIERSLDPNQDGNFEDKLDVISLSLGAKRGNPDDPKSTAIDNVVDAGVVAVIAAGNSGPEYKTIGSPGTARKAITVGASYKKDYEQFYFQCTPGEKTSCGKCNNDGKVLCDYWGDGNPKTDQITSFNSRGPVEWTDKNNSQNYSINKPDIVAPGALICAARHDNIFPDGKNPYYKPCLDDKHVQMAGTS
ncbi:MAG: S8 family serine peptidase, partial [Nanoarchaeota archaeon]